MNNFLLFVEGPSDAKFLKDFIKYSFDVEIPLANIFTTKSLMGFTNYKDNFIGNTTNNNGVNLLFIDADNDFSKRQKEVLEEMKKIKIKAELFLMPNNKDHGCLEDLLSSIATEQYILTCFDSYYQCIDGHQKFVPDKKDKIRAYLSALIPYKSKKGDRKDLIQYNNRDYRNRAHWDLNHTSLAPLKTFLAPFFTKI